MLALKELMRSRLILCWIGILVISSWNPWRTVTSESILAHGVFWEGCPSHTKAENSFVHQRLEIGAAEDLNKWTLWSIPSIYLLVTFLEFALLLQISIYLVISSQIYWSLSKRYISITLCSFLQTLLSSKDPHVHVNWINFVLFSF
jgi:hypothetical protein